MEMFFRPSENQSNGIQQDNMRYNFTSNRPCQPPYPVSTIPSFSTVILVPCSIQSSFSRGSLQYTLSPLAIL